VGTYLNVPSYFKTKQEIKGADITWFIENKGRQVCRANHTTVALPP